MTHSKLFGVVLTIFFVCTLTNAEDYAIRSAAQWRQVTSTSDGVTVGVDGLSLKDTLEGEWTSKWHAWSSPIDSASVTVHTDVDLFDNKTIDVLVDGSETPFTDADGIAHDWYGRCMIAILDAKRWVLALRSGVNHISWGKRDAIHVITSTDEGRSWSPLNRWFDSSPIEGMPYEDGYTHSEPGLYKMPNGELILQFWRTSYYSGAKQLRSIDSGKTWVVDHDRIRVDGVEGADDDMVIGTEDYFVDPENPSDVYMAFQYFRFKGKSGTLLARSRDNGKSYTFLSWIGPLVNEEDPEGGANFEPAIEYVGNRTIVAILRHASGNKYTWRTMSTDMGASFGPVVDISDQIRGTVPNGAWQRVRLYKESNPYFQHGSQLDYAKAEGRLWGFGIHSNGGGYTRKPVVYWSDDNGMSWSGPESLHGEMYPGTDTGYGDIKRRVDNTFVAATYYATRDSKVADLERYTFGGERVQLLVEADRDGDGKTDLLSGWREATGGSRVIPIASLGGKHWRLRLRLTATKTSGTPKVTGLAIRR